MHPKSAKGSRPTSPIETPGHSRDSSISSGKERHHAPLNPSNLRESRLPSTSPESRMTIPGTAAERGETSSARDFETGEGRASPGAAKPAETSTTQEGRSVEGTLSSSFEQAVRARLVHQKDSDHGRGAETEGSQHGTFSPRPETSRSYGSFHSGIIRDGFGGKYPGGMGDGAGDNQSETSALLGDAIVDGVLGAPAGMKTSTTNYLARRHGIRNRRFMYLAYYIPIVNWLPQYKWSYLRGDFISALTMASFYIPMSLSYASNLGHMPPINGLYSFVLNPIIYAVLGTCPQMVVGPEAPGSLLTGEVVRENIKKGTADDENGQINAEIAGIVTFMAGGIILISGLFRLGFLDSVLSKPFLRGFISAIGVVIFVSQLIPELGLTAVASQAGHVSHGSCVEQIVFLVRNLGKSHALTAGVSLGAFAIIMVLREMKKRLQPRYPAVVFIPDRFLVVVLSAILAWKFSWDEHGLEILGKVQADGAIFAVHWPFEWSHLKYASDAVNTAFIIALLGFFESSVAAKSLGNPHDPTGEGLQNIHISANRELVALGVANVTGGLFMALPAFGGYGRSKVNASTGGRTPMSSVFLSIFSLLSALFLTPYFYFLPKGVLSAMISVVAYSLIEEAPHDIAFFWRIRGWSELGLMLLIFVATIVWDIKRGIAIGIGLSLLRVVRHSTRPRIQILGRVPGTSDRFENAEVEPSLVEFIEGCLIVKVPEPLHFANTGDLRNRLKRLEDHGTGAAHPALPRVRNKEHNQNVIFDMHGVTSLDGAGAQVLYEIVSSYVERGVRVFFCRVPTGKGRGVKALFEASGIVELCGGERHFVNSVQAALRMTEIESLTQELGAAR
ncbi:high affinity sulfate transporter 1 [Pseudovirgaria hyperparasitica]|uniref:High affinity sulfate transporter 1 n=1 Tax=Pseudovirgaria hyperparasitica TaxID=470096 RepID=A0A6A6WHJ2_9PEZI|nr:high affinity sulfate transporter 1 [Pseudovirgaria hyperparasitica]KAF2762272.1 high affinity sulfate transporter 1 [Pseudovirgaria hyperparasitica]